MSVTAASFRADFPQEFGNISAFPNQAIGYWLAIANMLLNQAYWGTAPATASSPPTSMIDFATEMFVAHNLVLEQQAAQQAAAGGNPGTNVGIISNKSVGGVSVGYDISSVVELDGGFWNKTIYGMRFLRLARFVGSGPIQIGIGFPPAPFLLWTGWTEAAWGGPWPGIAPGDVGFG